MALTTLHRDPPDHAEPAWDIARLYPDQGYWTEGDYLELHTNHLVEFFDGFVEVPALPIPSHQFIVQHLSNALLAAVAPANRGRVLFAPLRIRLREVWFREPDVVFMLMAHKDRMRKKYWDGADLVMEVVSEDAESHERDWVRKRTEYAQGGIPEYWIVDPWQKTITVLTLSGKDYQLHGEFRPGDRATSVLLPDFNINVSDAFAAGEVE